MRSSTSARGWGAVYVRTQDGKPLKREPTNREELISSYYSPHHLRLEEAVERSLAEDDCALILDCHSFPSRPLPCDLDQSLPRPDFCLGVDDFHTPSWAVEALESLFREGGREVGINRPYAGSLVPLRYWKRDRRVASIMVEVRRDLYMDEGTGEPTSAFAELRRVLGAGIGALREAARGKLR